MKILHLFVEFVGWALIFYLIIGGIFLLFMFGYKEKDNEEDHG